MEAPQPGSCGGICGAVSDGNAPCGERAPHGSTTSAHHQNAEQDRGEKDHPVDLPESRVGVGGGQMAPLNGTLPRIGRVFGRPPSSCKCAPPVADGEIFLRGD